MAELFTREIIDRAGEVIEAARKRSALLATAETVTAGLLSAALTSVSGASSVFERGYVLYHSSAKATGLGVDPAVSSRHGAVSVEVTERLASGLTDNSEADFGVAITGYAGPTGGSAQDPVGTVYLAIFRRGKALAAQRYVFTGDRTEVKLQAVSEALRLLSEELRRD
jgi:nicotinamide-nucleotide amidase